MFKHIVGENDVEAIILKGNFVSVGNAPLIQHWIFNHPCVKINTAACDDCVMTFLFSLTCDDGPSGRTGALVGGTRRVEISTEELDTLSLLQQSGLAPASNFTVRPLSLATRRADLVSAN